VSEGKLIDRSKNNKIARSTLLDSRLRFLKTFIVTAGLNSLSPSRPTIEIERHFKELPDLPQRNGFATSIGRNKRAQHDSASAGLDRDSMEEQCSHLSGLRNRQSANFWFSAHCPLFRTSR
jgi:hypothetical protein